MSKRRSISIKGSTYQRLVAHCRARGSAVSGTLEAWIAEALGLPVPSIGVPSPPQLQRRSISVTATSYARVVAHCRSHGAKTAIVVDGWITEALDAVGAPMLSDAEIRHLVATERARSKIEQVQGGGGVVMF